MHRKKEDQIFWRMCVTLLLPSGWCANLQGRRNPGVGGQPFPRSFNSITIRGGQITPSTLLPPGFSDLPTALKWHMAALFSIAQLLHGAWTVCTNLLSNDWNAEPKSKWGQIIFEATASQAQFIWILLVALLWDRATKYQFRCDFKVYENLSIFSYFIVVI